MAYSPQQEQFNPPGYYDIHLKKTIDGPEDLTEHIRATGQPENVVLLGDALRRDDIEIPPLEIRPRVDDWTRESALLAVRGVVSILPEPTKLGEKKVNRPILKRAGRLRLVPGGNATRRLFGSYSNLYVALEEPDTHRIFVHEQDDGRLLDYVAERIAALGRLPTKEEYIQYARDDPAAFSYDFIHEHLGGVVAAAEKAGAMVPKTWDNRRRMMWGVEYYVANEELAPTQDSIQLLSFIDRAPSAQSIRKGVGSEIIFNQQVVSEYQTAFAEFTNAVHSGEIPAEVLKGVDSVTLMLSRYVRWGIADSLIENDDLKLASVLSDLPDQEFLAAIQRSGRWDDEKFQAVTGSYGVFQNLWKQDYLQFINLEAAVKARLDIIRGSLNRSDQAVMETAIRSAAADLRIRGRSILKALHFQALTEEGKIPSGDTFSHIFKDERHFRALVSSRLRLVPGSRKLGDSRRSARRKLELAGRTEDEFILGLPAGFINRIEELEHILKNPPPEEEIFVLLRERGWYKQPPLTLFAED